MPWETLVKKSPTISIPENSGMNPGPLAKSEVSPSGPYFTKELNHRNIFLGALDAALE